MMETIIDTLRAMEKASSAEPVAVPPNAAIERADTETLTLPTVAHLRQRIKQQKAGACHDEQLLKHLVGFHRLLGGV